MAKADVKAGSAYVSIGMKSSITKDLNKIKTELNDFGSSIMGIGSKVAGMGLAITGSLTAAVVNFSNVGDTLGKMAARTGVAASTMSELGFAAEQSGGTIEDVESSLQRMAKNLGGIGPESIKTTEALQAMGLSVSQIQSMSPEDQFETIGAAIAEIQDPTQKAAAAMAVFGASGRQLIPMLGDIKALREEARELGLSPSPESIRAAEEINDAINRVRRTIGATFYEIGAALAPMAMDVLQGFLTVAKAVRKFVIENKSLIITAAKVGSVLTVAGSAIVAIGATFVGAGMAISGVLSVMSLFGGAIGVITSLLAVVLSPVGILVAALVAGAYAWARFSESGRAAVSGLSGIITGAFGGIATTVSDTFGGIFDAIKAGDLSLAGQIAITGLKLVFAQGLEAITKLFGESIGKMASQVLSGDFAGAWSTLGTTILDSVANIASGMVSLFSNAANAVMNKWQETVNAISDYILQAATEGGAMGWALEQVSGVNMQEESARGKRIEAERRSKGMTPDNNLIADSTQYQDPMLQGLKDKVKAAGDAANAMMADATDATGQALADATTGQAETASVEVQALQSELAALRAQAAGKVTAMNAGTSESTGTGAGGSGGIGTKGSVASFSLAQLAGSVGRGVADKQLTVAQQQKKLQEKALELAEKQLLAMMNGGLSFP